METYHGETQGETGDNASGKHRVSSRRSLVENRMNRQRHEAEQRLHTDTLIRGSGTLGVRQEKDR